MKPDSIRLTEPFALIATVGRNMNSRPGTSGRLFAASARPASTSA